MRNEQMKMLFSPQLGCKNGPINNGESVNTGQDGRLITLEGLDGSGKATQTALLCSELERRGVELKRVSFPNYNEPSSAPVKMYLNGDFGKKPSDVNAFAASSFYAVDRFASFIRHWKREYESGTLIVADRYTTSNIIYQLPKLPRGCWDDFINWLEDFEYGKLGLPQPSLTLYLDVPTDVSQILLDRRYGSGGKKDIHESDTEYLESCRECAVFAAQKLGWKCVECVKDGKLRKEKDIHQEILKIVLGEL